MIKLLKSFIGGMTGRQKAAALSLELFKSGLAVYGFICSLWLWKIVFAAVACLSALFAIGYIAWKVLASKRLDGFKIAVSGFVYWFLNRNKMNELTVNYSQAATPIAIKPIHDESEVLRTATANTNKLVTMVETKLTLKHKPNEQDYANCGTFLEWMRSDALTYDAAHNQSGCGGFPRYYPIAVEINGQHLDIRFVVMNSFAALRYVRNPPEAVMPEISFDDDDFGGDIPTDDELI